MANFRINIGDEIVGETVRPGNLLYLAPDGRYYLASAADHNKITTELKFSTVLASAGSRTELINYGNIVFDDNSLIPNKKYYASEDLGAITTDLYRTADRYVRYIGTASSHNTLLFNPDQTYIKGDGTEVNDVPIRDGNTYTKDQIDNMMGSGSDFSYVHDQPDPSYQWEINYRPDKVMPSVTIVGDDGFIVKAPIKYLSENKLIIYFNEPFAGKASLN